MVPYSLWVEGGGYVVVVVIEVKIRGEWKSVFVLLLFLLFYELVIIIILNIT